MSDSFAGKQGAGKHSCFTEVHLALCGTGTIHDEARQRQEEIRSKLVSVDARARPAFDQAKDYYTSEEAAQFMKPKKKVSACDGSLSKQRQLLHD